MKERGNTSFTPQWETVSHIIPRKTGRIRDELSKDTGQLMEGNLFSSSHFSTFFSETTILATKKLIMPRRVMAKSNINLAKMSELYMYSDLRYHVYEACNQLLTESLVYCYFLKNKIH